MTTYLAVAECPRRVLSPLMENTEEEEVEMGVGIKPPSIDDFMPPPPRQAFGSESDDADDHHVILVDNTKNRSSDDITLDIALNNGCMLIDNGNVSEEEDDYLSDGSLSIHNDDDDYDTDLEVDTEGKYDDNCRSERKVLQIV